MVPFNLVLLSGAVALLDACKPGGIFTTSLRVA
jgi:hypothetical protein